MELSERIFVNRGVSEYNDDIHEKIFNLRDGVYNFSIIPSGSSRFWRFGIVLSREEKFEFNPSLGRYLDKSLRFIQINVGDYKNKVWSHDNKLEIATYYIDLLDKPIDTWFMRQAPTKVELTISQDYENGPIVISVGSDNYGPKRYEIPLKDYTNFRIFAWADETAFEILCKINIEKERIFRFPMLALSNDEKKYLSLIYKHFRSNIDVINEYELPEIWKDFPGDFNPGSISPLLLRGNKEITLWGIWHIDPASEIFALFEEVVFVIKEILSEGKNINIVSSTQVLELLHGPTQDDIQRIFRLMGSSFRNLQRGFGRNLDGTSTISLQDREVYDEYRRYIGLNQLMKAHLEGNGVDSNTIPEEKSIVQSDSDQDFYFTKSKLDRRIRNEFRPVMGVGHLAIDLSNIIEELPDERGQMIGIFGRWGRGKSFLLDELWKCLKANNNVRYKKVEFHAWKYQETPASWAYLYEQLADSFLGNKRGLNAFAYYFRSIKLNIKRRGWLPVIKFIFSLIISIAGVYFSWSLGNKIYIVGILSGVMIGWIIYLQKLWNENSTKAIDLIKKYTGRHSFKDALGIQADIQKELIKLLQVWIDVKGTRKQPFKKRKKPHGRKILLIVEDIDRCGEDRVIQNIDALRIMLEDEEICKRLIIVTAIDERILKNAIRYKYKFLYKGISNSSFADNIKEFKGDSEIKLNELISEYLDKLFICAVKLGGLSVEQRTEFFEELVRPELAKLKENTSTRNKVQGLEQDFNRIRDDGDTKTESLNSVQRSPTRVVIGSENSSYSSVKDRDVTSNLNDEFYVKLNEFEFIQLRGCIGTWLNVTPRKICIFYYRYLLCKNMLINKYHGLDRPNWWQSSDGVEAMVYIIRHFSDQFDPDKIVAEIELITESTDERRNCKVPGVRVSLNKMDYKLLLEVLEVVIAY